VAAKNDASYDLSRARASVTVQTTIAASAATTSLPNGRIVKALFAGALFRGTEVVDLVEAEAARDDRFTWALGKIWIVAKGLPPDVVERIVIASGNAIRPA
jgi:hypothetical protein